jgi:hypothetical protein
MGRLQLVKWTEQVKDRLKWKAIVEKAKNLPELKCRRRTCAGRAFTHSCPPVIHIIALRHLALLQFVQLQKIVTTKIQVDQKVSVHLMITVQKHAKIF